MRFLYYIVKLFCELGIDIDLENISSSGTYNTVALEILLIFEFFSIPQKPELIKRVPKLLEAILSCSEYALLFCLNDLFHYVLKNNYTDDLFENILLFLEREANTGIASFQVNLLDLHMNISFCEEGTEADLIIDYFKNKAATELCTISNIPGTIYGISGYIPSEGVSSSQKKANM